MHGASVELSPGPRRRAALHAAIPHRHTDRSAYDGRSIPAGVLARMAALSGGLAQTRLFGFSSAADRKHVGELMNASARAVTRDHEQSVDGFALFRFSWDDIQTHKDGLTLDAQGLSSLTTALAKMLPASSRSAGDKFWLDQTRKTHTRTAAAYGIVAVPDPGENAQRLAGGRLLQRVHLWTAANGLSLQHMNQMTERVDRERQLGLPPRFGPAVADLIPERGWQPLVSFRVAYPTGSDGRRQSPRRTGATVERPHAARRCPRPRQRSRRGPACPERRRAPSARRTGPLTLDAPPRPIRVVGPTEVHLGGRSNCLRAAVLGANDGMEARELASDPSGELAELALI